jgi:flagellar biosynthesis protein FlhB
MAEDSGDKTEAPTPRRREEAREQGNVARSADLSAAAMLLGALVLLNWFGGGLFAALTVCVRQMLGSASMSSLDGSRFAAEGILALLLIIGRAVLPLMLGVVLIALVANIAQVGLHLTPAKLKPDFGALNPLRGLGRLFERRSLVVLVMGVLKMTLVALAAYSAVHGRLAQIVTIERLTSMQMLKLGGDMLFSIGIRVGVLLLVLAIIDYAWQRWQLEQGLRMTKQEVKDEMRRMEGDPKLKQRRRQIAMQLAQKKLKKDVPTADVVITNPTEFAIALKYDAATMHAPRVIAKGQGFMARRIRELAIAAGVPILERKPLARALYKLVDVGHEIPEEFYSAVAEILAYVYELTGKVRARQTV